MTFLQYKLLRAQCCLVAIIFSLASYSQSQHEVQQVNEFLNAKDNAINNAIPSFYSKESTQGFQYFSHQWLRGVVIYANNQIAAGGDTVVKIDSTRFYNFDKFNNRLVSTQDGKSILNLSNDAISSFMLIDSGRIYTFKKNPGISKSLYLQPMVESDKGYSLYKHIITKLNRADYQNVGYGTTGKKYDEYVDSYEYYLVFPAGNEFKKIVLNTSSIKKGLKAKSAEVDKFFEQNQGAVTEETLYNLIVFLNSEDNQK